VVDQPLQTEQVEIERVAVNRMIDEPMSIRHEGDTMIIPLLEEVLVVEKRLVLREEVHIKKLKSVVHDPQEVHLREERVEIVRNAGDIPASGQDEVQAQ
jgi:stress response protein YsnF